MSKPRYFAKAAGNGFELLIADTKSETIIAAGHVTDSEALLGLIRLANLAAAIEAYLPEEFKAVEWRNPAL